jgi:hypothetical protein
LYVVRADTRLLVDRLSGSGRHFASDEVNGTGSKSRFKVGLEVNAQNLNSLVLKVMLSDVSLRADNSGSGTIRGGAALKLSNRLGNLGRGKDLLDSVDVSELRVGVVNRVSVVLLSNLGEMLKLSSVFLHVLFTGISEHLGCHRGLGKATSLHVVENKVFERVSSVVEESLKRASEHLLETESKDTVSLSSEDGLVGEVEGGTSSRAVVVDIDDGNSSHTNLVHSALSTGRVTINISAVGGLDFRVLNVRISHSSSDGDLTEGVIIVVVLARLVEASHSVSDDENARFGSINHVMLK